MTSIFSRSSHSSSFYMYESTTNILINKSKLLYLLIIMLYLDLPVNLLQGYQIILHESVTKYMLNFGFWPSSSMIRKAHIFFQTLSPL